MHGIDCQYLLLGITGIIVIAVIEGDKGLDRWTLQNAWCVATPSS